MRIVAGHGAAMRVTEWVSSRVFRSRPLAEPDWELVGGRNFAVAEKTQCRLQRRDLRLRLLLKLASC